MGWWWSSWRLSPISSLKAHGFHFLTGKHWLRIEERSKSSAFTLCVRADNLKVSPLLLPRRSYIGQLMIVEFSEMGLCPQSPSWIEAWPRMRNGRQSDPERSKAPQSRPLVTDLSFLYPMPEVWFLLYEHHPRARTLLDFCSFLVNN